MWLKGTAAASPLLTTRVLDMKHRCPRVISFLSENPHQNTMTSSDRNLRCPCSPKENPMIRSVPVSFDAYHQFYACVVKSEAVGGELEASSQFYRPLHTMTARWSHIPVTGLLYYHSARCPAPIMQLNTSPSFLNVNMVIPVHLIAVCRCEVCAHAYVQ